MDGTAQAPNAPSPLVPSGHGEARKETADLEEVEATWDSISKQLEDARCFAPQGSEHRAESSSPGTAGAAANKDLGDVLGDLRFSARDSFLHVWRESTRHEQELIESWRALGHGIVALARLRQHGLQLLEQVFQETQQAPNSKGHQRTWAHQQMDARAEGSGHTGGLSRDSGAGGAQANTQPEVEETESAARVLGRDEQDSAVLRNSEDESFGFATNGSIDGRKETGEGHGAAEGAMDQEGVLKGWGQFQGNRETHETEAKLGSTGDTAQGGGSSSEVGAQGEGGDGEDGGEGDAKPATPSRGKQVKRYVEPSATDLVESMQLFNAAAKAAAIASAERGEAKEDDASEGDDGAEDGGIQLAAHAPSDLQEGLALSKPSGAQDITSGGEADVVKTQAEHGIAGAPEAKAPLGPTLLNPAPRARSSTLKGGPSQPISIPPRPAVRAAIISNQTAQVQRREPQQAAPHARAVTGGIRPAVASEGAGGVIEGPQVWESPREIVVRSDTARNNNVWEILRALKTVRMQIDAVMATEPESSSSGQGPDSSANAYVPSPQAGAIYPVQKRPYTAPQVDRYPYHFGHNQIVNVEEVGSERGGGGANGHLAGAVGGASRDQLQHQGPSPGNALSFPESHRHSRLSRAGSIGGDSVEAYIVSSPAPSVRVPADITFDRVGARSRLGMSSTSYQWRPFSEVLVADSEQRHLPVLPPLPPGILGDLSHTQIRKWPWDAAGHSRTAGEPRGSNTDAGIVARPYYQPGLQQKTALQYIGPIQPQNQAP